jgi:hypothetical protein
LFRWDPCGAIPKLRKISYSFVFKNITCIRKLFQSSLWICK